MHVLGSICFAICIGVLLAVGDVVPLAFAWLASQRLRRYSTTNDSTRSRSFFGFIGTAKSEFYVRGGDGTRFRSWLRNREFNPFSYVDMCIFEHMVPSILFTIVHMIGKWVIACLAGLDTKVALKSLVIPSDRQGLVQFIHTSCF
jgi:hypothetical protein